MANLPARSTMTNTAIWSLFGAPPLLKGEDRAAFDKLLTRFSDHVTPTDTIEQTWVWDIAVLTWEIARYRRSIAGLYAANASRGLKTVLDTLYGVENSQNLADRWALREPEAISYVDDLLKVAGLTRDDITAQTLSVKISDIERIDAMIMRAEARRNSLFREIERRRATLGAVLRKSVDEIEEAEFTEIGVSPNQSSSAA